jgi:hypothetical protein
MLTRAMRWSKLISVATSIPAKLSALSEKSVWKK